MTLLLNLSRLQPAPIEIPPHRPDRAPSAVSRYGVAAALSDLSRLDDALYSAYGPSSADPELLGDLAAVTLTSYLWSRTAPITAATQDQTLDPGTAFLSEVRTTRLIRTHISTRHHRQRLSIPDWGALGHALSDLSRPLTSSHSVRTIFSENRSCLDRLVAELGSQIDRQQAKYDRTGPELYLKRAALLAFMYRPRYGIPWWPQHAAHLIRGFQTGTPPLIGFDPAPGRVHLHLCPRHPDPVSYQEQLLAAATDTPWLLTPAEASALVLCEVGPSPAYDQWRRSSPGLPQGS